MTIASTMRPPRVEPAQYFGDDRMQLSQLYGLVEDCDTVLAQPTNIMIIDETPVRMITASSGSRCRSFSTNSVLALPGVVDHREPP